MSWTVGSGNRNPSTVHMKAGILSKINYPTGGSMIFDFEPHKFLTSGGIVEGGGLRIKSIKNYDSNQVITNQQTYSYGENEDGLGIRLFDERLFSRNYEDIVEDYYGSITTSVGWCTKTSTYWHRQFFGVSKYNSINYLGSPILYNKVTKYVGNATSNIGKTVYSYNIIQGDAVNLPEEFVNSGNYGGINNVWNQAEPFEESTYKKVGTQYQLLHKKELLYGKLNQTRRIGILFKQYRYPTLRIAIGTKLRTEG